MSVVTLEALSPSGKLKTIYNNSYRKPTNGFFTQNIEIYILKKKKKLF